MSRPGRPKLEAEKRITRSFSISAKISRHLNKYAEYKEQAPSATLNEILGVFLSMGKKDQKKFLEGKLND